MRRSFAIATVLASFLAILLGVARYEARYSGRLAIEDLARLRAPGHYLASGIDEANVGPAVLSYLKAAKPSSSDPGQSLAVIEMEAAGALSPNPDPIAVSVAYQDLLKAYPESPLVHYRYGAYLLTRLQLIAREHPGQRFFKPSTGDDKFTREEEIVWEARHELMRAAELDQQNALVFYDVAYSYLAFGDLQRAEEWLQKGMAATEFDSGDDVVIAGAARVAIGARLPHLEAFLTEYKVAQFAPSFAAGRIEALASALLSDRAARDLKLTGAAYGNHLAAFEDMSEKLFQTASVTRQAQSSLVISGLLWRTVSAESDALEGAHMREVARRQLAMASYRYLLVGWERASVGLMPQQSIIELDTPVELRLPFSAKAQDAASVLFMALIVLALPAIVIAMVAIRVKPARELARALTVLVVFAGLAWSATFYSVVHERAKVTKALEQRLKVICGVPEFLRKNGQPAGPGEFRADIAKEMLYTYDYTLQAGRVLAYIGTQGSYDALIGSLSDPHMSRPTEVVAALEEATGKEFGRSFEAAPDGAQSASGKLDAPEAIRSWQKWWEDNRSRFPQSVTETTAPAPRRGA